ncbi:MAG: SpoIIE family protein phosphatase [Gemmatimonadetes bacterium]|nr:SpoIIE family protein phosphatase [Gemmatimonadota bacterium]
MRTVLRLPVEEVSQVGEARRQVARWTEMLGFDETCAGKVAIIVTEAAGNLAKHTTTGGELLVRVVVRGDLAGIEVLALDRGPGIRDIARALSDGYSTAGSPGTGLGAISRLADEFAIHSGPGLGTGILARLWTGARPDHPPRSLEAGVTSVPKPGEEACGDSWAVDFRPGHGTVTVVDGLGHGPEAAEAARAAINVFQENVRATPAEIVERMHEAMRSTRGAAVAIAGIDVEAGSVRYAGIGNISGVIIAGREARSLVSHPGTVGHQMRKVQEFTYPWAGDSLLVMHSDGVTQRWDVARYPGLAARDPALIAGVLYRDFTRGRDDSTVLVTRNVPVT